MSRRLCGEWAGGYVVVVVAHVIIVSAQSKELGFWFFRLGLTLGSGFGACWDRGLGIGTLLDSGLTIE